MSRLCKLAQPLALGMTYSHFARCSCVTLDWFGRTVTPQKHARQDGQRPLVVVVVAVAASPRELFEAHDSTDCTWRQPSHEA